VEMQDGNGRVWLRIAGWTSWKLHLTGRTLDFTRQPERYPLSERLDLDKTLGDSLATKVSWAVFRDMDMDTITRHYLSDRELNTYLQDKRSIFAIACKATRAGDEASAP